MSLIANPYGFSHIEKIGGKPRAHTYQFTISPTYATSLANGDPVTIVGGLLVRGVSTNTAPGAGVASGTIGTFNSVQYQDINGKDVESLMWVASTPVYPGTAPIAIVDIDPGSIYQVQCNAAIPGATAIAPPIGFNFNYTSAITSPPNTNTLNSTTALDTNAGGGYGVWRNCKIIGLADIPNNAWTDPFPDVLVIYNDTIIKPGTVGTNGGGA